MSQTSQTTETTQKTQTSYAGIAAPLVARVGTWLEMGANEDELLAVLRGTGPAVMPASPAWVQSMRVVGDTHNQRAGSAEEGQQSELAEREYRTAAFYYFLARFPHIMSPQAGEAYTLQRAAYLHASKYFAPLRYRSSLSLSRASRSLATCAFHARRRARRARRS